MKTHRPIVLSSRPFGGDLTAERRVALFLHAHKAGMVVLAKGVVVTLGFGQDVTVPPVLDCAPGIMPPVEDMGST